LPGYPPALIEGINTRKSNNNAEGDYDFTTLAEMQIVPTGGDDQTTEPGVLLNAIVKSGGTSFHGRAAINYEIRLSIELSKTSPIHRHPMVTRPLGLRPQSSAALHL
jgi:hypothetical protein